MSSRNNLDYLQLAYRKFLSKGNHIFYKMLQCFSALMLLKYINRK